MYVTGSNSFVVQVDAVSRQFSFTENREYFVISGGDAVSRDRSSSVRFESSKLKFVTSRENFTLSSSLVTGRDSIDGAGEASIRETSNREAPNRDISARDLSARDASI